MKAINPKSCCALLTLVLALALEAPVFSQTCPTSGLTSITTFPNTYYPATQASAPAGSTSISLGKVGVGYGSHAIAAGDILLIMQMQGADYDTVNSANYGDGTGTSHGYNVDANLLAGNISSRTAQCPPPEEL